jgi:GT2 family glycosyltransferase
MTVAVVTPWLNHPELTHDYRVALAQGPSPDETIIVDNASNPPVAQATIRNEENLGFAGASNQGLRVATADVVVFLNNDIRATELGWLEKLVDATEPGVLTGAKLRYDSHADVDGQPLPYLDGWCLAGMRSDLLALGGFDETLEEPAYYSDNLLCLRARLAGMTLREVPVGLVHKLNVTAGPGTDPTVARAYSANRERYLAEARNALVTA